jgi:outer membrane protein assembly factor BamB/tRNA A-37 threonylcarbamoyl transferase component Bud32
MRQDLEIEPQKIPGGQLQAGATLSNRYLIQDVIGFGGMGAVYRARDLHFPNVAKLVAVKEMVNQARDPQVRETIVRNFEREANILATLSHPAIPRIYDYFTFNERSYLILEYVHGKDLETLANEMAGFPDEARVVDWAIELCDVLHYLHTHRPEPIIFRDLKPSNVMINQHDHIVLVDFGIAKTFQSGERGTMIGTEGYSPPEQYRGEATALADLYALGATLHHLLTRRDPRLEPPFSFAERPLRTINPFVSTELERVIETALQYEPEARFQSALEMKAALALTRQAGLPAGALSPAMHLPPANRNIQPAWTFTCQDEIRGTPACEKGVLYFGSYDNYFYALQAASGKPLWKYAADGGIVSRPAVVADTVCFGSEDHRLHVISARSGNILWTYFTDAPVRSSPYLADGHIFIGSDDGCLHAVNLASGRRIWQTSTGSPIRSSPLVVVDQIYFGNEGGEFFCVDYRGVIRWRFKARRAITSSPAISEGMVSFGSLDASLYTLDARSGWLVWRYRLGKGTISTPAFSDGRVYTGAADGQIYCVESRTAREVWRFATEHQVTGSPLIYREALYVGSVDGHLYSLDVHTGRLRWKFRTNGPITGTPVACDDLILIGSTDRTMYALPA